jgi:hypothetical protein
MKNTLVTNIEEIYALLFECESKLDQVLRFDKY